MRPWSRALVLTLPLLTACAVSPGPRRDVTALVDPVAQGADSAALPAAEAGVPADLDAQLRAGAAALPAEVEGRIAAMTIAQVPGDRLAAQLEQQRLAGEALPPGDERVAARQAYLRERTRLLREAQTRHLLRAVHSPNPLQEQMVWFWFNHFNVHFGKANLRALVGDYEERAIRPHALGNFRDLVRATLRHPAMLRYLDNDRNAAGRINENYARELLELHTLGVDGGYTQQDVQELARVLTGVGTNSSEDTPRVRPALVAQYQRDRGFEFNPSRHDAGPKTLLGQPLQGAGFAEVDAAIDRLVRHPATARHVSRRLTQYFVADTPPDALVTRMAGTFSATGGDIPAVLRTLFAAPEFTGSFGKRFKDPVHYVVSAARLVADGRVMTDVTPLANALERMGQPLFGRSTPDGYPLAGSNWASAGQMATRFEVARSLAAWGGGGPLSAKATATWLPRLGPVTRAVLDTASPLDRTAYLLSSPEFMHR